MTQSPYDTKRRPYARQLGGLVQTIGDKSFRRRGFIHGQIVTQWPHIVGQSLASVSAPEALRFPPGKKRGATLTIRADGGAALEIQHHLNIILDRVNVYFGYGAVEKISIRQGPLPEQARAVPQRPRRRPLEKRQLSTITKAAKNVQNQDLKAALERLGETVLRQS